MRTFDFFLILKGATEIYYRYFFSSQDAYSQFQNITPAKIKKPGHLCAQAYVSGA
jgi:hypothetical protein